MDQLLYVETWNVEKWNVSCESSHIITQEAYKPNLQSRHVVRRMGFVIVYSDS